MDADGRDPEAISADRWMRAMRRGDFERAWEIGDEILERRARSPTPCWDQPRHLQFVWNGTPLAGKRVLVRCYHGLGDTIQFIRFASEVRRTAREVVVWAQPELVGLIASVPGVDRVLPLHDGTPDVEYDVDIEVMELPHALRTPLSTLQGHVPYLFPQARAHGFNIEEEARGEPGPKEEEEDEVRLRVGLVWRSGNWDVDRSVPVEALAALHEIEDVQFVSLQRGDGQVDAARLGIADIGSDDIEETAATIQSLDLVITVDTMMAHLAGAVGVPVWTLLKKECDWRWMENRSDSPWYPSMRLFRQHRPGDWIAALADVRAALKDLIDRSSASAFAQTPRRQPSNGTNLSLWRSDWR
ncbi:MAG TPA: glycosyltransferase family 9 protein [Xanthobacteraceae bacterium]|nr:glycosyltransferase family 9 protein [Xanthobacteraceae bacterium]